MTDDQKSKIDHFLSRPLTYIYDLDKRQIVAFVNGLEASDSTINLTTQLSNVLEATYRIKIDNQGWPQQIQKFADREAVEWWDAFKILTNELLTIRI